MRTISHTMASYPGFSNESEKYAPAQQRCPVIGFRLTDSLADGHNMPSNVVYPRPIGELHSCQAKGSDDTVPAERQPFHSTFRADFGPTPHLFPGSLGTPRYLSGQVECQPYSSGTLDGYQANNTRAHDGHERAIRGASHTNPTWRDRVHEAYPLLESPGNGQYNIASPDHTSLPQEVVSLICHGNWQQPLQESSLGSRNEASWSPLGCRTTSSPHLVISHSLDKGYDCFLNPQDVNANIGPLVQQGIATFQCDQGSQQVLGENPQVLLGASGTPTAFPAPLSLPSSAFSGTFSIHEHPPLAQRRTSNQIPECAQNAWYLKTGEPLVKAKTKGRQTGEEKSMSGEIRRLGGTCKPCRNSHRKVPMPR